MAARPLRVVGLVGGLALGVVGAGVAAGARPWTISPRHFSSVTSGATSVANGINRRSRPVAPGAATAVRSSTPHVGLWVDLIELALLLLVLVLLVVAVAPGLRARRERDDSAADRDAPPALEEPEERELAKGRLLRQVAVALDALDAEHDDRTAVIACWMGLEGAVAATGTPRLASETPGELVRRVLDAYGLDPGPIGSLHDAYVRARYSSAPLEPGTRVLARRVLGEIRSALGAGDLVPTR